MSSKITEYTDIASRIDAGDKFDVSKRISTSPDVYATRKFDYTDLLSALKTDLEADPSFDNYKILFSNGGKIDETSITSNGYDLGLGVAHGEIAAPIHIRQTSNPMARFDWDASNYLHLTVNSSGTTYFGIETATNAYFNFNKSIYISDSNNSQLYLLYNGSYYLEAAVSSVGIVNFNINSDNNNAAFYYNRKVYFDDSTSNWASFNIQQGTSPTSPNDGDVWYNGTSLYFRKSSTTYDLLDAQNRWKIGGNTLGADSVLGSLDTYDVNIQTDGVTRINVDSGGDITNNYSTYFKSNAYFRSGSTDYGYIIADGGNFNIGALSGDMIFINGGERGRLTSGGLWGFQDASPTAVVSIAGSTTARASLRVRSGTAPTSPNDGDIWNNGTTLSYRQGSTTYDLLDAQNRWKIGGNTLGSDKVFGSLDAYGINIQTNSTQRMYINSSGLIGMGVGSPDALLDIYRATGTATNKVFNVGSSTLANAFYIQENGVIKVNGGDTNTTFGVTAISTQYAISGRGSSSPGVYGDSQTGNGAEFLTASGMYGAYFKNNSNSATKYAIGVGFGGGGSSSGIRIGLLTDRIAIRTDMNNTPSSNNGIFSFNNTSTSNGKVIYYNFSNGSSTPANGDGITNYWQQKTTDATYRVMMQDEISFTDITTATRTSKYVIQLCNSGTLAEKFAFYGAGQFGVNSTADEIKANLEVKGSQGQKITTVPSSTATLAVTDRFIHVTYTATGAVTITLPSASSCWNTSDKIGIEFIISDSGANSSVNNITINRDGSDTITDTATGQTSTVMAIDGMTLRIQCTSSTTWKAYS